MTCFNCTAENADGRKFCRECGQRMVHYCQKCGFANALDDKYCGGCGMHVTEKEEVTDSEVLTPVPLTGNVGAYSDADMEELISEQSESKKKRKKEKETPAVSQDILDNIFDSGSADSEEKEG